MIRNFIRIWNELICNPNAEEKCNSEGKALNGIIKGNHKEFSVIAIEPALFSGHQHKLCDVESDRNGEIFLNPKKNISSCDDLPSNENWPASVTNKKDFWNKIDEYPGGCRIRENFIANLLNDIELNVPNENIWYFENKSKIKLSNQVVKDLHRKGEIKINGKVILLKESCKEMSDEKRAKNIFSQCLTALDGNIKLTANVLKLSTQVTMAQLGTLINWRFNNPSLDLQTRCLKQSFTVKKKKSDLIKIIYSTIWGVCEEDFIKYMKANVEMSVLGEDLEKGSSGENSLTIEKCSRFFDTFEDAENINLSLSTYPSSASNIEDYYYYLNYYQTKVEKIHPLKVRELLYEAFKNKLFPELLQINKFSPNTRLQIAYKGVDTTINDSNKIQVFDFVKDEIFKFESNDSNIKNIILSFSILLLKYINNNFNKKYSSSLFNEQVKILKNKISFTCEKDRIVIHCQSECTIEQEIYWIVTKVKGAIEDFEINNYKNISVTQKIIYDE